MRRYLVPPGHGAGPHEGGSAGLELPGHRGGPGHAAGPPQPLRGPVTAAKLHGLALELGLVVSLGHSVRLVEESGDGAKGTDDSDNVFNNVTCIFPEDISTEVIVTRIVGHQLWSSMQCH